MKKTSFKDDISEKELKLKFLYEDLRRKRLETKSRYLLQLTVISTFLFIPLFTSILFLAPSDRKDVLLFPFISKNSNVNNKEVTLIKTQIITIQESVNNLQIQLETLKNQPSENRDIATVKIQLDKLTTNVNSLNDTILEKPDTAITARLLREKQNTIDQKILDITNNQQRLEDRVDSFLSNLIAVPVYSAIAGLVFTIVTAITSPFLTKIKDKFFTKEEKLNAEELLGSNGS